MLLFLEKISIDKSLSKLCRPRGNATERDISSGFSLFAKYQSNSFHSTKGSFCSLCPDNSLQLRIMGTCKNRHIRF